MGDQFDFFESKKARDEALNQVGENAGDFIDAGIAAIARIPCNQQVTGEDIRRALVAAGIVPHHHNAWGSLIRVAIHRKLLVPTGSYRAMSAVKSHARRTPIYMRI